MKSLYNATINDPSWREKLKPAKGKGTPIPPAVPRGFSKDDILERWKVIKQSSKYNAGYKQTITTQTPEGPVTIERNIQDIVLDQDAMDSSELFKHNVENYIGVAKVPIGVVGPLRVNGLYARGDYYIPLATTEAALVASYNRGIRALTEAGGVTVAVVDEGVSRDPCVVFHNLAEVTEFIQWAGSQFEKFKELAESTTNHGKLADVKYTLLANMVHMKFLYTTGDASGQNMVTIATEAVVKYIRANSPVKPKQVWIEGGLSCDKKASQQHLLGVRGKKLIAECVIPKNIIRDVLKTTVDRLAEFNIIGPSQAYLAGTIGNTLHYSNAITAMAIALGQDPACASECHIGITHGFVTENQDAYCSVTIPNMLCASIGGGTKLPTQRACLEMMGLYGPNKANELAEVMAAVCLAGELSLTSAIVSDDFAKAHQILARGDKLVTAESPLEDRFGQATLEVMRLTQLPGKDTAMKLYGLYKQATEGDINIPKPSMFSTDLKARMKYNAWLQRKGMSKQDAMKEYIALAEELLRGAAASNPTARLNGQLPPSTSRTAGRVSSTSSNSSAPSTPTTPTTPLSVSSPFPTTEATATATTTTTTTTAAAETSTTTDAAAPEQKQQQESATTDTAANENNDDTVDESAAAKELLMEASGPARKEGAARDEVYEQLRRQIEELSRENAALKRRIEDMEAPLQTLKKLIVGADN